MAYTHKDILEQVVSISGLYEKIFGKLLDKLVFNQRLENQKNILKNIYLYDDVDKIFEKQIERKEFTKLSSIIFRFNSDNESNKNDKDNKK